MTSSATPWCISNCVCVVELPHGERGKTSHRRNPHRGGGDPTDPVHHSPSSCFEPVLWCWLSFAPPSPSTRNRIDHSSMQFWRNALSLLRYIHSGNGNSESQQARFRRSAISARLPQVDRSRHTRRDSREFTYACVSCRA